MDFTFDETQQAVASLAATVLRGEPDHARVEHALGSDAGYDETLWKAMAQAGLLALALPEDLGGDGMGPIEVAAVLAEVGRQTLPVPAFATMSLGVLPIVALGSDEQRRSLLPEVADGRILTAALRDTSGTSTVAAAGVITGSKTAVPYAAQAHCILVSAGSEVYLVDPHSAGVTLTRTPSSTQAPEYSVRFADAPAQPLGNGGARVLERYALAGAAALADGVVAGGLALTAEHVRTREQFDKPLATFQAVAGQVADIYIVARTINLVALSANWRLASGLDADDDLDIAAYWLASKLPAALQSSHHLHGGLGIDITYPLHRYYSHAKDLARFVGGAAGRLQEIGARCTSN